MLARLAPAIEAQTGPCRGVFIQSTTGLDVSWPVCYVSPPFPFVRWSFVMVFRRSLLVISSVLLASCAHHRAATFRFVDAHSGQPATNVEVAPLYSMYQPHIPLAFPVRCWFPVPGGEVYSDSHGEVAFENVSDRARFRISKDGYKEILIERTGPSVKMKYLPDDETVAHEYHDSTATIPLQRSQVAKPSATASPATGDRCVALHVVQQRLPVKPPRAGQ